MSGPPASTETSTPQTRPQPRRRRRLRLGFIKSFDLFVMREVLLPTAMGFVVYTCILLMRPVFKLMEQVFVIGIPFEDAGRLVLWSLPHMVVMTIPMALLFGVLIALGRMNSDTEIVALQAAGISLTRLLAPVLFLAFLMFGLNCYLTLKVNPESNLKLRKMKTRLFSSARTLIRVEPRVFFEDLPNVLLYVHDVDETTGYWQNVVLYDRTTPDEERLTLARRGRLVAEADPVTGEAAPVSTANGAAHGAGKNGNSTPWLQLEDAVTHQFKPSKPATYRYNANQSQLHKLFQQKDSSAKYRLGMRERSTRELLGLMHGQVPQGETMSRNHRASNIVLAGIELHERLTIPAASIVFALLALPLGIGSRSGGRGRGFIISIVVVLAYYVMSSHGNLLATKGRLPVWAGVWAPNVILGGSGLMLMRWMGRWLGERRSTNGSLLSRWWRQWRERRLQRRIDRDRQYFTGSIPVHLQRRRYATRFPALLDRWVVRRLLYPLALVLFSIASLYIIVDLTDHIDEMAKNRAPLDVIIGYYWNLLPQTIIDVTPLALMIAVLILFSVLERQKELTALKAAGLSLYRLIIPVLLVASVAAGALWMIEESVLPGSQRETNRLLDRIKGRETARSYRSTDRVWLMSREGEQLYNFLRFDINSQTMLRFTMFRFDEAMQLRFHLFAHRVRYRKGAWIADSGWFRQIYPDGSDRYQEIRSPLELKIPESPNYFGQEYRKPEEMTFNQLKCYIDDLVESGYQPTKLTVSLHRKLTHPLSAFIMVFLALPFALNRGGQRVTTMQSIAVALLLGIGYAVVLVAVFDKLGEANYLPPLVGSWIPPILATLFAINRLTTLRT